MSQCCGWPCQYERGGACSKRPFGNELLALFAEEALAEREEPPHQVYHGGCAKTVLD